MVDDANDVVRLVKSWSLDATLPKEPLAELVADDYVNHAAAAERAPGLLGAREVDASSCGKHFPACASTSRT